MTYTSSFSPLAEFDLVAAYAWYQDRGPGIANSFESQVVTALQAIQDAPLRWATWNRPEFRRYLLPKFPYVLVYRVDDRHITIVSFLHQRQDAARRFSEDP